MERNPARKSSNDEILKNQPIKANVVQKTSLNSTVFEKLKKQRGNKKTSGSVLISEFSNLKAKTHHYSADELYKKDYNYIYQLHYGDKYKFDKSESSSTEYKMVSFNLEFKESVVLPKLPQFPYEMSNLKRFRANSRYTDFLDVRAKLIDWLIEVFEAFAYKGTNEYTYFRAVFLLDLYIDAGGLTGKDGEPNTDDLHISGIAAAYLASKLLDYRPIDLKECYEQMAHRQIEPDEILKTVTNMINRLCFRLNIPTWLEYLDKLIYDVFGDYREELSLFNVRQVAVFILHTQVYDSHSYSNRPHIIAAVALYYSITLHYSEYEKTINFSNNFNAASTLEQKRHFAEQISDKSRVPKSILDQQLRLLFGYLAKVTAGLQEPEGNFVHLKQMFNLH